MDSYSGSNLDPLIFQVSNDILNNLELSIRVASETSLVDSAVESALKITSESGFPKAIIFFFVALFISFLLVGFN